MQRSSMMTGREVDGGAEGLSGYNPPLPAIANLSPDDLPFSLVAKAE
jgi:hypothetical protein